MRYSVKINAQYLIDPICIYYLEKTRKMRVKYSIT